MNDNLTILIVTDIDSIDSLSNCIESIYRFNNKEDYNIIIVYNGTIINNNISYNYIYYESKVSYGTILNNLDINTDIILLNPNMLCVNNSIQLLQKAAYKYPNISMVGCISNGYTNSNSIQYYNAYKSYEDAINYRKNINDAFVSQILASYEGAVYIKYDAIESIKPFDSNIISENAIIKDIAFRSLENGYNTMYSPSSFFWASPSFKLQKDYELDIDYMEKKYGMRYFNTNSNPFIVNAIHNKDTNQSFKVLEIGCDLGATLLDISNHYPNAEVYGVDITSSAIKIAKNIINAINDNIENCNLPYNDETFAYIIFGDVLEHLRNPKEVVQYCKRLLKKNGIIIASIPNLMHISIIKDLLVNGKFTYTEFGLLDKTHIHLFTRKEIYNMFIESGYFIDEIKSLSTNITKEENEIINLLLTLSGKDINREMYTTFQYLCTVHKE